jgi:hypothetical protein
MPPASTSNEPGSGPAHNAMTTADRSPQDDAAQASAAAPAASTAVREPWVCLTKGECLLLALALHRLSRQNASPAFPCEEHHR